jgi:hypothetical protein
VTLTLIVLIVITTASLAWAGFTHRRLRSVQRAHHVVHQTLMQIYRRSNRGPAVIQPGLYRSRRNGNRR